MQHTLHIVSRLSPKLNEASGKQKKNGKFRYFVRQTLLQGPSAQSKATEKAEWICGSEQNVWLEPRFVLQRLLRFERLHSASRSSSQASIGELRQHFTGLCETVQGFHVTNHRKFHKAPSSYLHRKWYAYHEMFNASMSVKMCLRCFRKPFSHLHLDPFSVLRALGNLRPTCTDCYPLTFNVDVRNTSLLTDAFIHRSSIRVHFNLKSHARLTSGLHNFPMQGAMHYHNRSQQRQQVIFSTAQSSCDSRRTL